MNADRSVPLILCTIKDALAARQFDRARLLTEGLCARLCGDTTEMTDWLRGVNRSCQHRVVPEHDWRELTAAVDTMLAILAFREPVPAQEDMDA